VNSDLVCSDKNQSGRMTPSSGFQEDRKLHKRHPCSPNLNPGEPIKDHCFSSKGHERKKLISEKCLPALSDVLQRQIIRQPG
jgi:hypothetical protein